MRNNQSAASLIDTLMHNAAHSGNRPLERRLADLTVWFHQNKDRISIDNLAGRQAFLEKAFWVQLEVVALLLERNQELEAAKRGMSNLWLPRGVHVEGDMRETG